MAKQLKHIHESKIIEYYFHDNKNVYEINRLFHRQFTVANIAKVIAKECVKIDKNYLVVQSAMNFI